MFLPLICLWMPCIPRRSPARKHGLFMVGIFSWPLLHNLMDINLCDTYTVSASPQPSRQSLGISALSVAHWCHRLLDWTCLQHFHNRGTVHHCGAPLGLRLDVEQPESDIILPIVYGIPFSCNHLPWF